MARALWALAVSLSRPVCRAFAWTELCGVPGSRPRDTIAMTKES